MLATVPDGVERTRRATLRKNGGTVKFFTNQVAGGEVTLLAFPAYAPSVIRRTQTVDNGVDGPPRMGPSAGNLRATTAGTDVS